MFYLHVYTARLCTLAYTTSVIKVYQDIYLGWPTKLTPVLGLEKKRWLMMSPTLWRHQVCILQTRISKIWFWSVNYTHDDVISYLLLSRPVTGISFKLIPSVEIELFNFVIIAFLICKIHRKQVTLFLSVNYWGLLLV